MAQVLLRQSILPAKPHKKPRAARGSSAPKAAKPATKTRNRRVSKSRKSGSGGAGRKRREPLGPEQRKARNRTVLGLAVLALVNFYVFVVKDDGLFGDLGSLEAASITRRRGPLPPMSSAPEHACGGDPVRIFDGLSDLLHLETSLRGGHTLRLALLALGVSGGEIDQLEASVRSKVDLGLLGGSGAPVRIATDRDGGLHAIEIELAEGRVLQGCRDGDGFAVRNLQHPLRTDFEVVSIELGRDADLGNAVREAGEKPQLARLISAALAFDVNFMTDARPHDKLSVMVEKRYLGRRFHRYGGIQAIRFRGASRRVAYYRYKPEGAATAFFDERGRPMRRKLLRSPVAYFHVDPEARGMLPPSVEVIEGRIGASYRLPQGAPLVALATGTIVAADATNKEGNFIDLETDDGLIIRYCHLMRFIGQIEAGMEVRQGQILGLAGHSGRTPHNRLRLEIWGDRDGEQVTLDPMRPTGEGGTRPAAVGESVPKAQMARFEQDTHAQRLSLRAAHG